MRRWIVLVLILGGLGAAAGRIAWQRLRGAPVTLAAVERGRVVEAVYATGRLDTDRRATVRARLAAPLEAVLVGPGEAVRAGQVVARQDPALVRLALERAEQDLEAARAARAEAGDAAARAERLARERLLPDSELVRARERARELAARADALDAAAAAAREAASWAELRSPLDGVVNRLLHRAGDVLREGDDVLDVLDLGPAYVRVAVDERDLGRVAPGQEARLVFDAFPDRTLHGSVWRVVPAVDRLTKSADVLVALPADRPPLQLDLTATVNVVTGVVEDALTVPREALDGSGAKRTVFRIDEHRRAVRRGVDVGPCDATRCQVLAGLAEGDRVISPAEGVREGDRVLPP